MTTKLWKDSKGIHLSCSKYDVFAYLPWEITMGEYKSLYDIGQVKHEKDNYEYEIINKEKILSTLDWIADSDALGLKLINW